MHPAAEEFGSLALTHSAPASARVASVAVPVLQNLTCTCLASTVELVEELAMAVAQEATLVGEMDIVRVEMERSSWEL